MKRAIKPISYATTFALIVGGLAYACGLPWWLALGLSVAAGFLFGGLGRDES